jgi:hypothetical protein
MSLRDGAVCCFSEGDDTEPSTSIARSALEHWQWAVRGAPFTARSNEARTSLRGLAAWYKRICLDDNYDSPAPADGLNALAAQEREPDQYLLRGAVVTHWSVRVAQELAEFRRKEHTSGLEQTALLASAKLDLALQGAFDRLR